MNTDQLTTRVADQLGAQQRLLVAFSGGLDSSVLLHVLAALRRQRPVLQLRALHVHHGLSAFADHWVEHCRSRCADWQIPLTVTHVQVDARQGGIEAAARAARYAAFSAALTEGEALLTAQHLDDQSETFLLALKRGSGPAGLSAMAARAALGEHLLLRPLLGCSRQTLESYAQRHALTWIDDDSNQDTRFDRNFLRLQVLPQLNQRWPHFASAVARSAGLCAEQEQLLDELLAEPLQSLLAADRSLAIDGLTDCSPVRRFALLRRWISLFNVTMPAREQLQRLWEEVALSREDAEPQLQLGAYQIRRFRGRLHLLPPLAALRNVHLPWQPDQPLTLPDGLGQLIAGEGELVLRAPQPSQQVSVRFGGVQGAVRIVGRAHSRPIKKLWQELGIPPWQRERIPLIYYDEQLIAALGVFVCEAGQVPEGERPWRLRWEKNHNSEEQ
ncbi:tRNA lysidine(34) synthetase TilS [Serratia marcescens]|uniref:tRNA lysidine(34) synthetase TilS n=1 Tax=Serratia marcescens TaxID=615 RepID=UPI00114FD835|nr:tRNA lysidine(34) synthetase TilS [Serratia marcescens]QDI20174.1 tRNA lysidine(34) synthetase TilS [Serratia marcescens]QDI29918.1 tRNA lysidine(34) synthetase TilS [Serratia marcescens]QDI44422.1 tRNA lysidine(34) synthetase TilS [Serratia marcescens]QDI58847.1 tRNA lysidine(34) synthetase TilS [Serratia marcescens]